MFISGFLHRWWLRRAVRRLRLRPGQQEQLDTLLLIAENSHSELRQLRRGWRDRLHELLTPAGFDREAASRLAAEPAQALQAHLAPVVDAFGGFYDGLDEHQRRRLLDWWGRGRCCHHGCHHHG